MPPPVPSSPACRRRPVVTATGSPRRGRRGRRRRSSRTRRRRRPRGVASTVVDDLHRAQLGGAGHRAGREQRPQRLDRADARRAAGRARSRPAGGPTGRTRPPSAPAPRPCRARRPSTRSLRSRSTIIRFSARNFGSVASRAPQRARPRSAVAPRGVVPLIGLVSSARVAVDAWRTAPGASSAASRGAATSCWRKPAYGAGLSARSRRYAVTGSRSLRDAAPVGQVDLVAVAGAQLLLHLGERRGVLVGDGDVAGRRPAGAALASSTRSSGVVGRPARVADRIHTASGIARRGGERREVGPAGVAEVADPVHVGSAVGRELAPRAPRTRRSRRPRTGRRRAGSPRRAPRRRSARRRRRSSQPRSERRPDHGARAAAVEPEAAVAGRRQLDERGRPGRSSAAPQEVRDQPDAVLAEHRLGVELHALAAAASRWRTPITTSPVPSARAGRGDHEVVGHAGRGQRVVADRGERRRDARRTRPVPSC